MNADDKSPPVPLDPTVNESLLRALTSIDNAIGKTGAEYAMFRRHGLDGPARNTLQVLTQLHEARAGMAEVMNGSDPFIALVGEMRVAIGGKTPEQPREEAGNVVSFEAWRAKEEALLDSSHGSGGESGPRGPA